MSNWQASVEIAPALQEKSALKGSYVCALECWVYGVKKHLQLFDEYLVQPTRRLCLSVQLSVSLTVVKKDVAELLWNLCEEYAFGQETFG